MFSIRFVGIVLNTFFSFSSFHPAIYLTIILNKIYDIRIVHFPLNSSFETYFNKRFKADQMAQTLIEKILQQFADDFLIN